MEDIVGLEKSQIIFALLAFSSDIFRDLKFHPTPRVTYQRSIPGLVLASCPGFFSYLHSDRYCLPQLLLFKSDCNRFFFVKSKTVNTKKVLSFLNTVYIQSPEC